MKRAVDFYSEGFKLCGDVYTPDDLHSGEKRAAVRLCPVHTGGMPNRLETRNKP